MAEKNLNKFTINYLTEEQYAAAREAGTLNDNDFYCTSNDLTNDEQGSGKVGYITLDESSPAYVGLSDDGNELLCFNAWQLEPGLYNVTDNIRLYYATADSHDYHIPLSSFAYFDTITVIGPKFGEMRVYAKGSGVTELFLSGSQGIYYIGMMNLTESAGVGTFEDGSDIIMGSYDSPIPEVIDNVTTVSSLSALSAYQGKLLNEKITALEARIAELEAGGIDLAVNPTDTTNRNIWIETE